MAVDVIDVTLDEVDQWAASRGQVVHRDDMRTVLELSRDYLEHDEPTDLVPGDVDELLMDAYPQAVILETEDEAVEIVRTVRDLLLFLADTERMPALQVQQLTEELDEVEPEFVQATVDGWPEMADDGGDPLLEMLAALGLPTDQLPPMRLPASAELATAARQSRLLAKTKDFAIWVGDGKSVSSGDLVEAPPLDSAELPQVLNIAEALDFLVTVDDTLQPGPGLQVWPDGVDPDVVGAWTIALGVLLSESLAIDAELAGREDIDFGGAGGTILLMLFLLRSVGLPVDRLSDMIRESIADDWDAWVADNGDPALTLVSRLTDHNAVTVEDGVVRLTPLGLGAMRHQLVASGVEVPVLPPIEEMTAADLAALAGSYSDDEMAEELAAWLALRDTTEAAQELLAVAAEGDAVERFWATSSVADLGEAVQPVWHSVLEHEILRPYAKLVLTKLGEAHSPTMGERGWIAVDAIAVALVEGDLDRLLESMAAVLPEGDEEELFDAMWRLPHPDLVEVLNVVGEYHPDKKVAKLARRAANKATSR
jgi:hypothetical protein